MAATSSHSFTELMRLSRAQTESQQANVNAALEARQRKQAEERRKQVERERKEKEEAKRRRERWVEELKRDEREKERKKKLAEEAERNKADEERKRRMTITSGHSPSRGRISPSKKRPKPVDDDGDGLDPDNMLTREEKRQRRIQRQRASQFEMPSAGQRRSTNLTQRYGKKLAGGVNNIVVTSIPQPPPANLSGMSIKERLSKMPMTLTKLNVNKRDTRTIDEILRDRQREKEGKHALVGDEAKAFDGWFTPAKKAVPQDAPKASSSSAPSKPRGAPLKPAPPPPTKKRPSSPPPPSSNKKPRSLPAKRPSPRNSDGDEEEAGQISSEIWKMFGKDRNSYVRDDIFSDDEDMEAGADDLEEEELFSARIAKREDDLALKEEKRHEEEKRRRKLAKAAAGLD